jgi:hypothetical protein
MSRGAGSSTKSISPEISAASRVASLAMGVKTISCTLPSKLAPPLRVALVGRLDAGLAADTSM